MRTFYCKILLGAKLGVFGNYLALFGSIDLVTLELRPRDIEMIQYQVQFLEPLSQSLNLLGVEVGGHADLVARLVTHLDRVSNFRNGKNT